MQVLWTKENRAENLIFVDPFTVIGIEYENEMRQWQDHLNELKSTDVSERSQKCNRIADELMHHGHAEFSNHNWSGALNFYSRALCFAKVGSIFEGIAYGNRGTCFFQMGMFRKALKDFDSATNTNCPDQFLAQIQGYRIECQKLAKQRNQHSKRTPKMKLPVDKKIPCMANVLEIKGNKEFGRYIAAKKDIDIGQTLFVSEIFASAVTTDTQAYCLTCHRTEMNFIPCIDCSNVMFCDEDCANWNTIHKTECQTSYHQIDDISVKLVIQTILVAIELFPSGYQDMVKFVERVTSDAGHDKIPKCTTDSQSKYGIFLKLTPSYKDDYLFRAYKAFTSILLIPKIKYLFDTEVKQRFLMHLIVHHTTVIPKNAFHDIDQFNMIYIFDVLSIINHSCAPNMHFKIDGKIGSCVSVRPIKKGDQVFINYLGDDVHKPTEQRQRILKEIWAFDCKCDKCDAAICDLIEYGAMKEHPSLMYVIRNYDQRQLVDNAKRFTLKKQCNKFLNQFGHMPWSTELEYVIQCFTSL